MKFEAVPAVDEEILQLNAQNAAQEGGARTRWAQGVKEIIAVGIENDTCVPWLEWFKEGLDEQLNSRCWAEVGAGWISRDC